MCTLLFVGFAWTAILLKCLRSQEGVMQNVIDVKCYIITI